MRELRSLQTALDGELFTPASAGYDAARRPALARFHGVRPMAVVSCASTRDIARTLAFARHSGTHVVPRGGGHCFAGRSSTAGLVLDLSRECVRLTGLTPRELLGDAVDRCGCGHDHAASYGPFLAARPRAALTG